MKNNTVIPSTVKDAYDFPDDIVSQQLSTGLINHTYKVKNTAGAAFLLQKINTNVFTAPFVLQQNYQKIKQHFEKEQSYMLPKIITTKNGDLLLEDKSYVWRCFEFINDTYSPTISTTPDEAWLVANCFGTFSARLSNLDPKNIETVLPGFHDLSLRFRQFQDALAGASEDRKQAAAKFIQKAQDHQNLVTFYEKVSSDNKRFPLHILHHDCKIANILFKRSDHKIYSPIDFDTTQPGLFFSDIGDMIRSMVPNYPEDHAKVEELTIREAFYEAVRDGYLEAMHPYLSKDEMQQIDLSGNLIVYMQALRFLTDYLNQDIYYQTKYPAQNLDRAANQFQLLSLLIKYIDGSARTGSKHYLG